MCLPFDLQQFMGCQFVLDACGRKWGGIINKIEANSLLLWIFIEEKYVVGESGDWEKYEDGYNDPFVLELFKDLKWILEADGVLKCQRSDTSLCNYYVFFPKQMKHFLP